MIIIGYLKPYNYAQTNNSNQTKIITWNCIIISIT